MSKLMIPVKKLITTQRKPVPKKNRKNPSTLQKFLLSAQNPFQYAPPALGYEMFVPPLTETGWTRSINQSNSAATCATVIFDPFQIDAPIGNYGAVSAPHLAIAFNALATQRVDEGALITKQLANHNYFISQLDTYRPLTGAVRASVRYAATSAPGRLYALNTSASTVEIAAMSTNDLLSLDSCRPLSFDGSGVAIVQGNWRQHSAIDFYMSSNVGRDRTIHSSKTIIIAVGWTSGFILDVETIAFYEGDGGVLASSQASDATVSLALTTPLEVLGAKIRSLPSVLNKETIARCEAAQLKLATSRGRSSRIPKSVLQNDYVDVSSSAGEFVSGMGESVRNHMPSAAQAGAAVGTLLFGAAVRSARHGMLQN